MLTILELFLVSALLLTLVKATKYQEVGVGAWLVFEDYSFLLPASAGAGAFLLFAPPAAAAALLAGLFLLFLLLWLDALLFRLFGVELQPPVVRKYLGDVLGGGFSAEAGQLGRFLATSSSALLPPLAAAALLGVYRQEWALPLLAPLGLFFLWRARSFLGGRPRSFWSGASYVRHLFPGQTFADDPRVRLHERHLRHLRPPAAPPRGDRHGLLAGANVLLLTLEGVARDHLRLFSESGAETPALAGLAARSIVSRHHFCISPQTTNAHRAIYAAGYPDIPAFPSLAALRRAGYRTAYLTAEETVYFGLGSLLAEALFDPVFEHGDFAPHPADPGRISDYVLLDQGLDRIAEIFARPGPAFVHVHTKNTHKNYRVVDRARFARHPGGDQLSRYRNCLEEMDWLVGELLGGLRERGLLEHTLVVVTSDHGQAFGEAGYYGHSNAVIKEEVNVPLLFCHPRLEPAEIDFSSHFDILPTCLDLLGIEQGEPVQGESLLAERRPPSLLLYSEVERGGAPSSCGLIDGRRKYVVDQIAASWRETDWNDAGGRELDGDEKAYFRVLFFRLLEARKLLRP